MPETGTIKEAFEALAKASGMTWEQFQGLGARRTPYATALEGASVYQRLSDEVSPVTQQLWANLDSDDLAAANRVHLTITQRANELLAK